MRRFFISAALAVAATALMRGDVFAQGNDLASRFQRSDQVQRETERLIGIASAQMASLSDLPLSAQQNLQRRAQEIDKELDKFNQKTIALNRQVAALEQEIARYNNNPRRLEAEGNRLRARDRQLAQGFIASREQLAKAVNPKAISLVKDIRIARQKVNPGSYTSSTPANYGPGTSRSGEAGQRGYKWHPYGDPPPNAYTPPVQGGKRFEYNKNTQKPKGGRDNRTRQLEEQRQAREEAQRAQEEKKRIENYSNGKR